MDSDAVRTTLVTRLKAARKHLRHAAELDTDAVHDLRVAARRLRAACGLFLPDEAFERDLQQLQDALGEVRDAQVQLAWLAQGHRGSPR